MNRIISLGLIVILFAVMLEGTVRFHDWLRFRTPFLSSVTQIDDLSVIDSVGLHGRPGANFRHLRINSLGFKGPELPTASRESLKIIATVGASETFGLYETAGNEWPRQLESALNLRCATQNTYVLNAAIAGMSTPWVLKDVENRLAEFSPTAVVFYMQPSQYLWPKVPAIHDRHSEPLPRLAFRSKPILREQIKATIPERALDFLRSQIIEREQARTTILTQIPSERLDSLEFHLRRFAGITRRARTIPILVVPHNRFDDTLTFEEQKWLRAWTKLNPRAPGSIQKEFSDSAVMRMRRVAADSSMILVDPPFPRSPQRSEYFADPVHFTDRGAKLVAETVASKLSELLACGPLPSSSSER